MERLNARLDESAGLLGSILRGAVKILGCHSANLIAFNTLSHEVRILVGVLSDKHAKLRQIESVAGSDFQSMVFRLEDVTGSMVYSSWRDRTVYETDSLAELVGNVFPAAMTEEGRRLIGEHRFICVPVSCGERVFGVIIFTKEDPLPFGIQQREILLRYAQRIGEIIEFDLSRKSAFRSKQSLEDQLLYFALGETAPALLLDPEYLITSCNDAAGELLGHPPAELVGRPVGGVFRDPRDIENILKHQFLFMADGYYEDRAALRHKSGRIIPGRIKALLLADESDQVIGFMVLIREEGALGTGLCPEDAGQLLHRERLVTMGEMAAQLAHELRNPLVAVGATLESLAGEESRDGETRGILKSLAGEVSRMDMLLRDYMSLAARRNAVAAKVDLARVLDDALRLLSAAHAAEGKEMLNLLPRGLEVLADHDGMRQVFLNLLRNALEATPAGRKVTCSADAGEHEITVFIDDDGTGLSRTADECFQPFFTTKTNGTGLGLTVCLKTVKAYGGMLTLENRPQGGCRAAVILPRRTTA